MSQDFIKLVCEDYIGIMQLNNPIQNNIPDPDFIDTELLKKWVNNNKLKGIILTGTGKHFSAGADIEKLKELSKDKNLLFNKIQKGLDILSTIANLEIPVLAAIKGVCFGGGLEIALASHIRICSTRSLFAFPETELGLIPGLGGTLQLSKLIGSAKTAQMILSAEIINAEKAQELKIIDYIVPPDKVMSYTKTLLKKMVENRPIEIINSVMRALHNAQTMSFKDALEEESRMFCQLAVKSMEK